MRDFIETYTLLILALGLFAYACASGVFDCKEGCRYEKNQTEIHLTTKGQSE